MKFLTTIFILLLFTPSVLFAQSTLSERNKTVEISEFTFTFDEFSIIPNSLIIHLEDSTVVNSEKYLLNEIDANIKFTDSSFIGETILMNYRVYDTSVNSIGRQLLSYGEDGYILPFEVISILLLAAMIAAIIIAKKEKE